MCISVLDWVETRYAIFFWKIPSLCQFISGRHMNGDSRVTTYAKGPDFPLFFAADASFAFCAPSIPSTLLRSLLPESQSPPTM